MFQRPNQALLVARALTGAVARAGAPAQFGSVNFDSPSFPVTVNNGAHQDIGITFTPTDPDNVGGNSNWRGHIWMPVNTDPIGQNDEPLRGRT